MVEAEKWYKHFNECCETERRQNGLTRTYLIKCPYCNGKDLKKQNISITNGSPCEYDYYCEDCKKVVGGWSYGSAHD